jgi:outer membrane receptor for ferrienterochelin and colicins
VEEWRLLPPIRTAALLVCATSFLFAQTLRITVQSGSAPVPGATVTVNGDALRADTSGVVESKVELGTVDVKVSKEGFLPGSTSVAIDAVREFQVVLELQRAPESHEEITVHATRTETRLEDSPTRVEVLGEEEIEEKVMMTPGDIVMMLNEMGGLRVQTTSPGLGAASVRIQGMRGRYTRFLADGLPLFGQQGGGLGLLQIPPMDLGQVEVIKGAASALYGAGAMGGVVDLISRRPSGEPAREFLLNRSTLGATDTTTFLASKLSQRWSASLLAGGHWQERRDRDDDGWADLAGYGRGVARPRFFWDGGEGRLGFLTGGITYENREGGTMRGAVLPATGAPYAEALDTRRYDVGGSVQMLAAGRYPVMLRGAASSARHGHRFGEIRERDRHEMIFGEASIRGTTGRHTWVAGAAVERDAYRPLDVPRFAYRYVTPGVFVQDDVTVAPWFSVSASARTDFHNVYGTFFSPRLSALARAGGWTGRLSAGQGFFAPTPLTEETEAAGLSRLTIAAPLVAERGRTASFDLTRAIGPMSYTATVFASRVDRPVHVERSGRYELTNLPGAARNTGAELLGTFRQAPFSVTASYTYVRSREEGADTPLTPRQSFGLVGMWEKDEVWRVGVECYYTGRQRLEENPYRSQSEPYVSLGMLVERRIGPAGLFLNAENLTDARQTRWDRLVRPSRAADGRWTVDAWAPLDGRVINGGVRFRF